MGTHSAPRRRGKIVAWASACATFLGVGSAAAYVAHSAGSAPESSVESTGEWPAPVPPYSLPTATTSPAPISSSAPAVPLPRITATVHKAAPKVKITLRPKPVVRYTVSGTKVQQLIAFLRAQLGKPYAYGGTGPDAYDCSGLVQAAYASIGIDLPRTSEDQATVGSFVNATLGNPGALEPGDILVTHGAGHDAIYIGNGQYIGAENSSEPIGIYALSWDGPFDTVRRVL